MNPVPPNPDDLRFELMLDGLLQDANNAEPRPGEAALQRRIDSALSRRFAPPDFQLDPALASEPVQPAAKTFGSPQPARSQLRSYLLAAGLLIACAGLWGRQIVVMWREAEANRYESLPLADLYRSLLEAGFQPDWKCADDKQFAETFAQRQKAPLFLATLPQGSTMLGLSYLSGFTRQGTAMLARVDGEPVVVLVDRTERLGDVLWQAEPEGLNRHIVRLGPLTLIELSRAQAPKIAPFLQLMDSIPETDTGRVPGEAPRTDGSAG